MMLPSSQLLCVQVTIQLERVPTHGRQRPSAPLCTGSCSSLHFLRTHTDTFFRFLYIKCMVFPLDIECITVPAITLSTAYSKLNVSMDLCPSLAACRAASLHMLAMSAPAETKWVTLAIWDWHVSKHQQRSAGCGKMFPICPARVYVYSWALFFF